MTEATSTPSIEETNLLALATELSRLMGTKFAPIAITWMSTLGHISDLPSDQCYFFEKGQRRGTMLLPLAVKGQLELAEWRPLITSALAYQFRPEFRRAYMTTYRLLTTLAWIPLPLVAGLLIAFGYLGFSANQAILLTALILTPIVIARPFLLRANRLFVLRKLHLRADILATQIAGRDALIRTLGKIDAMHIRDLEEAKGEQKTIWRREGSSSFPTISERLDNLRPG